MKTFMTKTIKIFGPISAHPGSVEGEQTIKNAKISLKRSSLNPASIKMPSRRPLP